MNPLKSGESEPIERYDKLTEEWVLINPPAGGKDQKLDIPEDILLEEKPKKTISRAGKAKLEILSSLETVLDFNLDSLNDLSKVSNSIINTGQDRDKKIIIPSDILEYISEKAKVDIQKYITNSKFKERILKILDLKNNYGFLLDDQRSALVMLPISYDAGGAGLVNNRFSGLTPDNIEFILNNILKLDSDKKRISFIDEIINDIDLSKLSNEELSRYLSSGNYINFVFDSVIKKVFLYAENKIDKEISVGIAGFLLRKNFDMELNSLGDFFTLISRLTNIPRDSKESIMIGLEDVRKIIESKNISIQKYIDNPLFKKKIRQFLKLENDYGLLINTKTSHILMIPINPNTKRFAGLEKREIEYIISDIMGLDDKAKKELFFKHVLNSINLSNLSSEELSNNFSSGKYIDYLFFLITKVVYKYSRGNFDINIAKGVAGSLLREDFDFINSNLGSIVSSELGVQLSRLYRIDDELDLKLKNSIAILESFLSKAMDDGSVTNFRKAFNNDIFIDFSEKIKHSFSHLGLDNIDENLIKGIFMYIVNNGTLKNPMKDFAELVFSRIIRSNDKKLKELAKLFGFFNSKVEQIGGERFKYPNFKFRDLEIDESRYSVERIFIAIQNTLQQKIDLESKLGRFGPMIAENELLLKMNTNGINACEKELIDLSEEKNKLENDKNESNANIPEGFFNKLKRKKVLSHIEALEKQILEINKEIENKEKKLEELKKANIQYKNASINNPIRNDKIKVEKEIERINLLISRMKEDFANTLFYGLRQTK